MSDDLQILHARAAELQAQLNLLERRDWPRWLREADHVTREIGELKRRAAWAGTGDVTRQAEQYVREIGP